MASNTEIVLNGFKTLRVGDWKGAAEVLHPDFVRTNAEDPDRLTDAPLEITGQAELTEFWNAFFERWEEWSTELGEALEGNSGKVLVPVRFSARAKGASDPFELSFFEIWEVGDGKLARCSLIRDRERAFAAAGLSGQSRPSQP